MKILATVAFAGLAALCLAGSAEAMPVAAAPTLAASAGAPVVKAAVLVTKRVVRPMRAVVTRRVVRRGPLGGRVVTTTRTVR